VAIATTVIIAESMVETIVSCEPATASTPRVVQSAVSTTPIGTTTHLRLRKKKSSTPPVSVTLAQASTVPSHSSIAKPSRSMAGSPATVPAGNSPMMPRSRSIVSARETACWRAVTSVAAGGSSVQATATVRRSAPTT